MLGSAHVATTVLDLVPGDAIATGIQSEKQNSRLHIRGFSKDKEAWRAAAHGVAKSWT